MKIDRSLVGVTAGRTGAAVARGLVALGHSLGLTVAAEGVGTQAQWEALRALGCDLAQGPGLHPASPRGVLASLLPAT
jgi:EAL domain-containing protein (putative c-di-GMP-specific phosphodiesterase class I)